MKAFLFQEKFQIFKIYGQRIALDAVFPGYLGCRLLIYKRHL